MQKSYLLTITGLLLILTLFFVFFNNQNFVNKLPPPDQHQPVEYMKNIQIYNYNNQGELNNSIFGEYWELIGESEQSIVNKPKIVIYNHPEYVYIINANLGHILNHKINGSINYIDLIKLNSEVIINQKYLTNHPQTGFTLMTEYLDFNPATQIATTTKPVTMVKPGLSTTGIGMNINLKLNELELHKQIAIIYQNPSTNE